ncbi:uncharacterized protein EDB91DRAFT_418361 [Suillus paluster]|uniref:uncharacterized protein n=1 Tax=Suillus paluster TaxID=48578 RepID=UPI001B86C09C|nr:uncharacterized protein EDB91DRAFT_418361 [Suillus paluster]KAG1753807.1 hypothetical protein EDB91DRAFT_418361 [Suillus paluster]
MPGMSPQGVDFFDMEPKPERATFEQFMQVLQKFTGNFDVVKTSSCPDPSVVIDGHEFQPDIALYNRGSTRNGVTDMSAMEAWITIKPSMQQDPFDDPIYDVLQGYHKFERSGEDHIPLRAQMVACADAFFATQFRRFGFSILVCGYLARFVRWDRAGAIVSRRFDYTDDSLPLAQFLWRLNCASPERRGVDMSVTPATLAESEDRFVRNLLGVRGSDPLYCYMVPGDNARHDKVTDANGPGVGTNHGYIGPRPTLQRRSLLDRTPHAIHVWDPRQMKVVFFKETWREDPEFTRTESAIYRTMHDLGVPNIPPFEHGGDMYDLGSETVTQAFHEAWWCCDRKKYHPLILHRMILGDIGRPLSSFRSTHELMTAIKDAVEAHKVLYVYGDILHRNITTENIRITSDGRGFLMGWEFCFCTSQQYSWPLLDQTGTQRFMAAALLDKETKSKPHRLEDDMESFLHVLMYTLVRYLPSDMDLVERIDFFQIFDEKDEIDGLRQTVGRKRKRDCVANPDHYIPKTFKTHPVLDRLLRCLFDHISVRYQMRPSQKKLTALLDAWHYLYDDQIEENDFRRQLINGDHGLDDIYDLRMEKLTSHDWMLEELDYIPRERERWPEADAADHNSDILSIAF